MSIAEVIKQRASIVPVVDLDVNMILRSPYQARRNFDPEKMAAFAENIKEVGQLNPIIVRGVKNNYELIAGERRWRAIKDNLGLLLIQGKVIECTDREAADICASENFLREDLLPSEKGDQAKILLNVGHSNEEIAVLVGCKLYEVPYLLKIAEMPPTVRDLLDSRAIKATLIPVIANIDGEENQVRAARLAMVGKLSKAELIGRTQHFPQRTVHTPTRLLSPTSSATAPSNAASDKFASPVTNHQAAPLREISASLLSRKLIDLQVDVGGVRINNLNQTAAAALLKTLDQTVKALGDLRRKIIG